VDLDLDLTGVTIRRVTAEDGFLLKDVRLRAVRADPGSFTEVLAEIEHDPDEESARWAADLSRADADSVVFLAFAGDPATAIGIAGGSLREEPDRDVRVFGVWIDPAARGRGVARRLVTEVIAWARTTGRARMTLCVMETSTAAIALYRALGFEEEGCAAPSRVHEGASELAMALRLEGGIGQPLG